MGEKTIKSGTDLVKILVDTGKGNDIMLQKLADIFPSIIYIYNTRDEEVVFINNKLTILLGYSEQELTYFNNDLLQLIKKEEVLVVQEKIQNFKEQSETETLKFYCHILHKKGTPLYFNIEASVVDKNENGNPLNILFTAHPIRQDQEKINSTVQRGKLFNENDEKLFFGNWTWDKESGVMTWSDGMYNLLGYKKEDLTPLTETQIFFNQVAKKHRARFYQAFHKSVDKNEAFNFDYSFTSGNGVIKNLSSHGKIVTNDKNHSVLMIGSTFDITAQLKNHQDLLIYKELKHENEKLLGYGTWVYNFATKTIHWSDGMYLLFGYDPETDRNDLQIDEDIYFKHMDSQQVKKMLEKRKIFLENGMQEYTWEYEITTKNNKDIKKIESYSRLVKDETGHPIQIVGTSRDISRLREYERSLEEKVKDLDRSNKELEEFAYVASHDLQEPLRKLTTFSERLQNKYGDKLDEEGNSYLDRMLSATKNMRKLIDNLLEYSRTTTSTALIETFPLNLVLNKVLNDLELTIEETNTIVEIGKLPVIECIPGQLSQLFINIIGNAIKFRIPDQQPLIKINSRLLKPKERSFYLLDELRNYYMITISDNGIGFEEEYAQRIFQIFQRLHSKAEYPGTGIGLSICKKIVENHKGLISATGQMLKGATFTIILPETQ
ncbi:MAG: PAS domain-containing protein [Chitinophagaceae bacterium]|nr:PAS domain-containing protein [Chitinophagaceae bacterium]